MALYTERMRKGMSRRRYSPRTIETYLDCVRVFLKWIKKDPKRITKKDVRLYLEELADRGKASSTLNVHLQAIKYLVENHLGRRFYVRLPYSKVARKAPEVLTKEEIILIFSAVKNEKHLLLLELMYSAGLRVSELVTLRVGDLDLESLQGWVRCGKGGKDRPFIIASRLKERLRRFVEKGVDCALVEGADTGEVVRKGGLDGSWLFRGQNGHYSVRSVQEIIKQAAKKAGIKKCVHPHTLRHSFATHLIEEGVGVMVVQGLLGHGSAQTTMGYCHMANPRMLVSRSPYDSL